MMSGCSPADNQSTQLSPPAASFGDEPPPPTPEPQASRRGRIVVRAFVRDQPVAAHVRFLDVPRPIEGEAGESISAEAGTQRIEVAISDSALLDRPQQLLEVFVAPDKESVAEAHFPWARVRFDVMVQGRRQVGVPIKLLRKDVVVAELKSGAPAQTISPGKYEADVLLGGRTLRARGLALLDGATQNIPLQF
jgi:hypothetical protein